MHACVQKLPVERRLERRDHDVRVTLVIAGGASIRAVGGGVGGGVDELVGAAGVVQVDRARTGRRAERRRNRDGWTLAGRAAAVLATDQMACGVDPGLCHCDPSREQASGNRTNFIPLS